MKESLYKARVIIYDIGFFAFLLSFYENHLKESVSMNSKHEIILSETMSSSQFAEMTGISKSNINKKIKKEFKQEIDDSKIIHQVDSRGYVSDYFLPELESKMLAALLDKSYLRKITTFWIEKNSKVLSPAEQLLENAKRLVAHEKELAAIKDRQDTLEREQFETKVQVAALVEGEGYYTIVGHCKLQNKKVDSKQAAELGKRASEICRNQNFSIGSASHPLFGKVNTYPQEVLDRIIN